MFRPKNISLSLTESQFEWKDLCDLMPTIVPPTEVMFFFFCIFFMLRMSSYANEPTRWSLNRVGSAEKKNIKQQQLTFSFSN